MGIYNDIDCNVVLTIRYPEPTITRDAIGLPDFVVAPAVPGSWRGKATFESQEDYQKALLHGLDMVMVQGSYDDIILTGAALFLNKNDEDLTIDFIGDGKPAQKAD